MKPKLEAFDVIADNYCEVSPRELAHDLLNFCSNFGENFLSKKQNAEFRMEWEPHLWSLAYTEDEETGVIEDLQEQIVLAIEISLVDFIPVSTTIACEENQRWIIQPVIQEEYQKFEECPEEYSGDIVYIVNDHGNVTCYKWYQPRKSRKGKYIEVWSMV
jgi:hypothetical protein